MSCLQRLPEPCLAIAVSFAALLACAAAGAADGPSKSAVVTVLDEACVDRRTDMCLRLALGAEVAVLDATLRERCSVIACGRGWYKLEVESYGGVGPLCVCERRSVPVPQGQQCAEGFRESVAAGPDGAKRAYCELPDLRMERFPGWEWPATPWDLMTCLQFARIGPGSGLCRRSLPAKDN